MAQTIMDVYNETLKELNKNNFFVVIGNKPTVINTFTDVIGEKVGDDGKPVKIINELMNVQSVADWKQTFINQVVEKEVQKFNRNGGVTTEIETKKLANEWIEWPERKTYLSYGFDPSWIQSDRPESNVYNSWKGLSVSPKNHETQITNLNEYWNFVKEILCDNDDEILEYIQNWCAHVFQKPSIKTEIALILRGQEGIGKNTFSYPLGKIMGRHYSAYNNMENLLGRFNSHLLDKVLVLADEATWGGAKQQEGIFKDLVTGEKRKIEYKGKEQIEVGNYTNLIVNSNNDWCVAAGLNDRRLVFLNVSNKLKNNHAYWTNMYSFLKSTDFLETLLHFLLSRDISKFNPRERPLATIQNGQDVQQSTLDNTVKKFIIEFLSQNQLDYHFENLSTTSSDSSNKLVPLHTYEIENTKLFKLYQDFCDEIKAKHPVTQTKFSTEVFGTGKHPGYLPVIEQRRKTTVTGRHKISIVPGIRECRLHWETTQCNSVPQYWDSDESVLSTKERKTALIAANIINFKSNIN